MVSQQGRLLVFIGSYAEAAEPGLYVYALDEQSGELTKLEEVSGLKNPTFVNVDAERRKLYSIAEAVSEQGGRIGEAAAFEVDADSGKLRLLGQGVAIDGPPTHIDRSPDNRYLALASYSGSRAALASLTEDGRIGAKLDGHQHEGKGVNEERQEKAHPHSANFSPDGKIVFVPDLGIDRIRAYRVEADRLQFHADIEVQPGAGPRHMAFHPNGRLAFVINELDGTIISFRYHADAGLLEHIQTVPTLPDDFAGENTCAEIAVSEDGRFVYGSNRGHDSIVVYSVDADSGKLAYVQHVSTEGEHPRHFALVPGGGFLIAANRDTNNLAVFRVDRETGKLHFTGHSVQVSKPVCVKPVYM